MVLQAAGLPSEHSSTSTSRQTFTLVEDQHKNGDVDFSAPRMLIPETKLGHPSNWHSTPNTPQYTLHAPKMFLQNSPVWIKTGEDSENPPLQILYQPAGCSLSVCTPAQRSSCCPAQFVAPGCSPPPGRSSSDSDSDSGISSSDSGIFWDIIWIWIWISGYHLGDHRLIRAYSGNASVSTHSTHRLHRLHRCCI